MDDLTLKLKDLRNTDWTEYIELMHAVTRGSEYIDYQLQTPYSKSVVTEEEYNAYKLRVLVTGGLL